MVACRSSIRAFFSLFLFCALLLHVVNLELIAAVSLRSAGSIRNALRTTPHHSAATEAGCASSSRICELDSTVSHSGAARDVCNLVLLLKSCASDSKVFANSDTSMYFTCPHWRGQPQRINVLIRLLCRRQGYHNRLQVVPGLLPVSTTPPQHMHARRSLLLLWCVSHLRQPRHT